MYLFLELARRHCVTWQAMTRHHGNMTAKAWHSGR